MTFTEAAIEILRRAGKPLHFKEIASEAMASGLLSHVGQTPEATMGARLLAMARKEHDRRIAAIDTGVFALEEWGLTHAQTAVEATQVEEVRVEEAPLRPKERHPALQGEQVVGARRDDRRRRSEEEDGGRRKKKYLPPAEVAFQWLREQGQPATLADLAHALRATDRIAEALERDLHSLERALQEENRRRTDSRRTPLFTFDAEGRVSAVEQPKEQPRERPPRPERQPRREEARLAAVDEQRRNVIRTVRRRVQGLDLGGLERVAAAFLEASGYRELNMTRRTKDGALYLARRKWGSGELRYAVRMLKPGRDIGRAEVQESRRDLAHYSAQICVIVGTGECSREAKSESNAPGTAPALLYGGEAFAEVLVDAGLGAVKRLVEWVEYDDELFVSVGGADAAPLPPETEPEPVAQEPAAEPAEEVREDRGRRGRDRRRDRRPREEQRAEPMAPPAVLPSGETSTEAPSETASAAPAADAPPMEPPASPERQGDEGREAPTEGEQLNLLGVGPPREG